MTNETVTDESVIFDTIGQAETNSVVSLLLSRPPKGATVNGAALPADAFDHKDGVLRVRFPNRAETIRVTVTR